MKDDRRMELDVENNVLRYRERPGDPWKYRENLVGGSIIVGRLGVLYHVKISAVHYQNCTRDASGTVCDSTAGEPYWTEIDSGAAETYRMIWVRMGDDPGKGEVCDHEEILTGNIRGLRQFDVTVFEGEFFDPETLNISSTPTTELTAPFNIACIGSLPAKQAFTRRTRLTMDGLVSTAPRLDDDKDDRQALVRAWAAEYCPGISFTHQGHQIRIRDRRKTLYRGPELNWDDNGEFTIEAVWDSTHAVCLNTPRLEVDDPHFPAQKNFRTVVENACKKAHKPVPPPCPSSWFPNEWVNHGDFLTATVPSK